MFSWQAFWTYQHRAGWLRPSQPSASHAEWGFVTEGAWTQRPSEQHHVGLGFLNGTALLCLWPTWRSSIYREWSAGAARRAQKQFGAFSSLGRFLCWQLLKSFAVLIWAVVSRGEQACQKMFPSAKFTAQHLSLCCVHFFDFLPVQPHWTDTQQQTQPLNWPSHRSSCKITAAGRSGWGISFGFQRRWWSNRGCCGPALSTLATGDRIRFFPCKFACSLFVCPELDDLSHAVCWQFHRFVLKSLEQAGSYEPVPEDA